MATPVQILKQYWGYGQFRPLQEDIVQAVLDGNDVLALLPTGGGKSICFQVPAMAKEGLCIVVSPLIALMKDQVEQLKKRNIPAAAVFSGMSMREIDIVLDNAAHGALKFLYLSPERLQTEIFKERIKRMKVSLLAVDEAHCISQWGYDFRPPYLLIAELRALIPEVNVVALTATATHDVKLDIQQKLEFKNAAVFQKSFARDNLSYAVRKEEDKERKLLEILSRVPGTAVVYVRSRKRTKEVALFLQKNNIRADFYHAGLGNELRSGKQDAWINNRIRVIVSTNAFGMGIDKPDVRLVVHLDLPDTLEAYYQEAGRAGRDEKKAYAVILYNDADVDALRSRLQQANPPIEYIQKVYQSLANYYKIAVGSSLMESYNFDIEDFCKQFNLKVADAFHAIKKLEEEGFLQLNEGFYQPSRIFVSVAPKVLYEFQIANAQFDHFIKVLLRMYGGELFSNFVKIAEPQLASALQMDLNTLKAQLDYLHKSDLLVYDPQKDSPQVTFITARYDASKLPIDKAAMLKKAEKAISKAESVVTYTLHKHRCRTQLLLEYFDEISYQYCGICDYCSENKKTIHHPIDLEGLTKKIHLQLQNGPLHTEALIAALGSKKEEADPQIRNMVESGELVYDESGRLHLGKSF